MKLGKKDYLKLGDWNALCQVCGFKFKASELRLRWDNLRVCAKDYEERHPQDTLRGIKDNPAVQWASPDAPQYIDAAPVDGSTLK